MPPTYEQPRRILPLPPEAIAQIHSSKHITSLQGVVLSLLENSLDAGSTKVDITVDWKRGNCTVEDDGTGIASEEFAEGGGLGRMYCTSKRSADSSHVHGSNGIFLAEVSSMSLLTITSTHFKNAESAVLSLHQGKVIARRLPESLDAPSMLRPRRGTHIAVNDLFGNMPVRIKQRALSSSDDPLWQNLKRSIVAFLVAWPKPCSVKLRNANSPTHLVNISGLHKTLAPELTSRSLRRLASRRPIVESFDPTDVLPILFQSGFASPESRSSWVPLSASTSVISLKGMICKEPAPTKQCQFMSLGVMPCSAVDGHGEWYECVNRIFANSGFGIVEDDTAHAPQRRSVGDVRSTRQIAAGKPGKGIDRHPMFCLQLDFKENLGMTCDPTRLSETSLKVVEDILEAAVTAWLEAHLFRPRKRSSRKRRNEDQEEPSRAVLRSETTNLGRTSSLPGTPMGPTAKRLHRTSKDSDERARLTDMFGRPITRDSSTTVGGGSEELTNLSRMRSGRPRSGLQPSRQEFAMHRPSEDVRPFTADDAGNREKRRRLAAPPIEAGEFNGRRDRKTPVRESLHRSKSRWPEEDSIDRCLDASTSLKLSAASSDDFGSINSADLMEVADRLDTTAEHDVDDIVSWTDPATKQVHRVNSRTGVVMAPDTELRHERSIEKKARLLAALDAASLSSAGRPLSLSRRSALAARSTFGFAPESGPEAAAVAKRELSAGRSEITTATSGATTANRKEKWLPGFLREWNNPVFALRNEPPIPVASHHGPGLLLTQIDNHRDSNHSCHSHANAHVAGFSSDDKGVRLSKAALKKARVISQVDRKFILAVLPQANDNGVATTSQEPPAPTSLTRNTDTLVLIDQHAASERIMLEELLDDLCTPISGTSPPCDTEAAPCEPQSGVQTVPLDPVLEFDLPSSEQVVLDKHRAWFLRWGIVYQVSSLTAPERSSLPARPFPQLLSQSDSSALHSARPSTARRKKRANDLRLRLTHLPPCIAARCQKEPRLAIELIRGEAWRVAEEGIPKDLGMKRVDVDSPERKDTVDRISDNKTEPPTAAAAAVTDNPTSKANDTPTWLPLLPLIPTALLSLLHSRACRSAIMFNDVLDREACEELVEKLARCVFPFVCAHGRVGVVPVGVLDGGHEGGGEQGFGGVGIDMCTPETRVEADGERLAAWIRERRGDGIV